MNCFVCLKSVTNFKLLRYHVNAMHNVLAMDKFTCNQHGCLRSFHNIRCLYNHIRSNHNINNLVDECDKVIVSTNDMDTESAPDSPTQVNDTECDMPLSNDNHELAYILKLYGRLNLMRKDIESIINDTKILLQAIPNSTQFKGLETEYLIKRRLIYEGIFIEPEQFVLGYANDKAKREGTNYHLVPSTVTAQYVSLKETFLHVFSVQQLFNIALQYLDKKRTPDQLHDLKDGSKCIDDHKYIFPFVLYYDEIECGNPLGSHKGINKIGAIYVSLRCFPPHFYSSLKNIYICCLFPSTDRSYLTKVIDRIVPEIISLNTEGLRIHGRNIIFRFCGVLGDNLGLHQFLGFVESFSANYYCRFCMAHKKDCQNMIKEDFSLFRNSQSYKDNIDKPVSECGINYDSVLNTIPNYHVTENAFVDLMHDFAEGVGNWGMLAVINYYVTANVLTIDILNERIKLFPLLDVQNRPPPLSKAHLIKDVLPFSASEMMNLIFLFALMVGDLIPVNCKIWHYYLKLKSLLEILCTKTLSKSHSPYISVLIEEHHSMYTELFKKSLRPKHHILTHYPSCLLKVGPFGHYWSMRFESNHTLLKCVANVVKSRINLCKSVAVRLMFLFSSELFKIKNKPYSDLEEVGAFDNYEKSYDWIIWRGIKFMRGYKIWVTTDHSTALPIFGTINKIEIIGNACILFQVLLFTTEYLSEHFDAYVVVPGTQTCVIKIEDCSFPLCIISRNNANYINNRNM